jgi:hypothetical protein
MERPSPRSRNENRFSQGTRLRRERDVAGDRFVGRKRRLQAHQRIHVDDPHAVRADEPHPVALDDLDHLLFKARPRFAHLLETGGDHHHAADALPPARFERRQHVLLGDRDDCEIDGIGDLLDAGVALQAVHDRRPRVDGKHLSLELEGQEVVQDAAADRASVARGANHRDRLRPKERIERGGHSLGSRPTAYGIR